MKKLQWHKKSIASFFLTLTVILVLLQVAILISLLISGGVFKQAKINSYKSFNNTVNNRRDYLQQEMKNRWTNLAPYLPELSLAVSGPENSTDDTLELISEPLIQMLRQTGVTGVYLILDNPNLHTDKKTALYLRSYAPLTAASENDDIYVVYGPAHIASKYQLPLDATWQYNFTLTAENKDFFEKPLQHSTDETNANYLGYWHEPFQLTKDDTPIITYSMPLQDVDNKVVGVIGIELSVNHLTKFLPMIELQPKDSLGYVIAKKDPAGEELHTMITTNNIQKRFLDPSNQLLFNKVDEDFQIFTLDNNQTKDHIYASSSKLNLYEYNSPFQEEWYIIGFMNSDYLLNYVNRIAKILAIIVMVLLISGVGSAFFISRRMSKPVVGLAHQVVHADKTESLALRPTGLLELDGLSKAIVQTNQLMLDSASRLSKIIGMVELPIGAFEVNMDSGHVIIAGQLHEILGVPATEKKLLESKDMLDQLLHDILLNPESDNCHVYQVTPEKEHWVKIKFNVFENHVYGLVEDVTEEVLRLRKVKRERDLDPLTKLLNHKSFQKAFNKWHQEKNPKVAALIMFDLDFLKMINDTYGHKWGDHYILETAKRLSQIADNNQQLLARRSGDEFVMLLHGFEDKDALLQKLTQFYEQLAEQPLLFPGEELRPIRISAGFVWLANDKKEMAYDQLLHRADEALYYSKQYTKGSFTEFNDDHSMFFDA